MQRPHSLAFVLLLALCACAGASRLDSDVPPSRGAALDRLAEWLTGTFSSTQQALEQPDDFLDIRLVVVPIWESRRDGPWLYVEQAATSALERPYRQRVYRLSLADEGGFESEIYELPGNVQRFVGTWRRSDDFRDLTPSDLIAREGCTVHLVQQGTRFVGKTRGKSCESRLGRATYATTDVSVGPDLLETWDRGFAADGEQVWGSAAGPYRFVRTGADPPR